ncbi:MAG: prolipoprotein diacylglyceryl transferase [Patescibacteria group bacterium]
MIFQFHLYGFFVGLGIATALLLFEKVAEKEKLGLPINQLTVWMIIPGIVGARVYHLVTDWQLYTQASFWDLIAVWNGGIGIIGALIGGVIGLWCFLYVQKKVEKIWLIGDMCALSLPFGQAIGRWGNFFNQELYGVATSLPWGIHISAEHLLPGLDLNARYHPLFLYESLAMVSFGVLIWWMYRKKALGDVGTGKYLAVYGMYYAVIRFLLEFLRIESSRGSVFPLSILTTAQWMMVGVFVVSTVLFYWQHKNEQKKNV